MEPIELITQTLGNAIDSNFPANHPIEVPDPTPNEFYFDLNGRTYRVNVTDVTE